MKVVTLDLPLPPSVNRAYYNVAGAGRRKASCYRQWEKQALSSMWPQKPAGGFPFFATGFDVHIAVPLTMRGDIDNRMKLTLDFLKKPAGIISDDRHAQGATISRSEATPKGMCRVTVYETKPTAAIERIAS
jgi:Holliday junction resolvase RusA-like endonuclease